MSFSLVACGNANDNKEVSEQQEAVEDVVINENILAVAEADEQFDNDVIIERANNRMKKEPEFYAGSKVPKIDSCVTEIVYDTTNSSDGNYIYYFGEGADAWVKGINTFNEKQSEPIEMLCACSDHCLLGIMLQISRQRIIRHTCSLWS